MTKVKVKVLFKAYRVSARHFPNSLRNYSKLLLALATCETEIELPEKVAELVSNLNATYPKVPSMTEEGRVE